MSLYAALIGEALCWAVALTTGGWLVGWVLDELERK